jgi:flagellar protein FlaG
MGITMNTMSISASTIPGASSTQKGYADNVTMGGNRARLSDTTESADQQREQTEKVQKSVGQRHFSIAFSTYGRNNEKISVTLTDIETGEVIREIPPEEIQRLSVKLGELAGMFVDDMI